MERVGTYKAVELLLPVVLNVHQFVDLQVSHARILVLVQLCEPLDIAEDIVCSPEVVTANTEDFHICLFRSSRVPPVGVSLSYRHDLVDSETMLAFSISVVNG